MEITTNNSVKATIKQLAKEIDDVLNANETSNEMNALIDFGEWSQSEPDFTELIREWGLTREKLVEYANIAHEYSEIFLEKYPKENAKKLKPWTSIYDINPWIYIAQTLNCVFMAGELNED